MGRISKSLITNHLINAIVNPYHLFKTAPPGDERDPQPVGPRDRGDLVRVQVAARGTQLRALLSPGN